MTNEINLLKLLKIAVENGCKIENECMLNFYKLNSNLLCFYRDANSNTEYFSLNDLISNWEKNEISFIDALSKASKDFDITSCAKFPMSVRQQWIFKPTSQRLDWLFETFSHLLKE